MSDQRADNKAKDKEQQIANTSLTSDCKFQSYDAYQAHLIRLAHPHQFGKLPLTSPQCAFYILQILPPH